MQTIILGGSEYNITRAVNSDGKVVVSVDLGDEVGTLYGHGEAVDQAIDELRRSYRIARAFDDSDDGPGGWPNKFSKL